jgi:hypothetical protein
VGVNELYEIDGKKKEGIIIWDTQVYKKKQRMTILNYAATPAA